ncbi:MAG: FHA domain-containing protein [Hespellia sp.]|nr:FHA domain-containing protein [Hespellia sp.]
MNDYQEFFYKEEGDGYISYVFEEDSYFSTIGFKVMESQKKSGYLACVQTLVNGKIKLTYPTKGYRRLDRVLQSLNREMFLKIVTDLVAKVEEIQENSFLKCCNLDLSLKRIFIDWKTFEVYVAYLPITDSLVRLDEVEFETSLRKNFILWSEQILPEERDSLENFRRQVQNFQKSLGEFNGISGTEREASFDRGKTTEYYLRLSPVGMVGTQYFEIHREPFIIGRSRQRADGQVESRQVGNTHCRILCEGGKYYAMDLNSRNGTYLNGIKIPPLQACVLSNGDTLLLADTGFRVEMRKV